MKAKLLIPVIMTTLPLSSQKSIPSLTFPLSYKELAMRIMVIIAQIITCKRQGGYNDLDFEESIQTFRPTRETAAQHPQLHLEQMILMKMAMMMTL